MKIDLSTKIYYTIGEVSKAFNVNTSLIRFWEKEFEILNPKKNKKGNRLFTNQDIKNLKTIYHLLKEKSYTIEGAKQILQEEEQKIEKNVDLITRLEYIKSELLEIKNHLDQEND